MPAYEVEPMFNNHRELSHEQSKSRRPERPAAEGGQNRAAKIRSPASNSRVAVTVVSKAASLIDRASKPKSKFYKLSTRLPGLWAGLFVSHRKIVIAGLLRFRLPPRHARFRAHDCSYCRIIPKADLRS